MPDSSPPCWFCQKPVKSGEQCRFSCEFDTVLHEECLQRAVKSPPPNEGAKLELEIIAREFGLTVQEGE